ncbi:TIGR01777 family oxidoreductase [Flavobacterium selenitireducens]|uniref:TIGR01777 family oxidoreductase n=1 Tax=Flavobacterium selenitireducens TaxID=2722704 RepID=UPI00168B6F56|nr:TIGR01777 family oxidoreductase [Flavobacterium selenitireducens]MBD3582511.1 TIGR01777 family protein [Flavobacterium selenitireducens]
MKVLISGATGLIGKQLIARLAAHQVSVHYLTTKRQEIKSEPHLKGFFWNPAKEFIDEKSLDGVDAIIHLAGANISKRWTRKYKQEIVESRVLSANLLLKALKENPNSVRQFISASAIGIYKDSLTVYHTENSRETEPSFIGCVVKKWEAAADRFASMGIKVCKVRTGLVLAREGGMLPQVAQPVKFGFGAAFGSGKQWQSWIHINDLVEIYIAALQQGWEGTFNATAPVPVTNQEMVAAIAKALNKPYFMPNLPEWLLKLMLGEMATLLFLSQKVSPERTIEMGYRFQYETIEKALPALLK